MIGKGARSKEVVDAMKRNTVVYLGAIGGAGALIAQSIKKPKLSHMTIWVRRQSENLKLKISRSRAYRLRG